MANYHTGEDALTATPVMEAPPETPPPSVTRRGMLVAGAALSGVMAVNKFIGEAENRLMDQIYGSGDTTITLDRGCDIAQPLTHASISSPGWNGTHGKSIVNDLIEHQVYAPTFPNGYYQFNGRVTPESVSACSRKFGQELRPQAIDVHGVSEGTMIALTGALAIGQPIRMITSNDSPFDINDAHRSFEAKIVAKLNELGLYSGGILGKYTALLGEEYDKNGLSGLGSHWRETWGETLEDIDPRVIVSQTAYMAQANLKERRSEFKHTGVINSETQVVLLKTEQTDTDDIVRLNQATDKWLDWYHYFGIEPTVVLVPVPGHAKISAGIEAGAEKMRQILGTLT